MFEQMKSLARGAIRRIATAPVRLLAPGLRAQSLEVLSNGMIAKTPILGGALKFYAPSPLLQDRATTVLTKEPDMIRWIDGFAKDAVLWDIGANVGVFSLYAAARTKCTVLSFEPSASNFFVLARNIQLNGLNGLVTAYCIALSGNTELGVLNLGSLAMGTALNQFGKSGEKSRYLASEIDSVAHGMVGFTIDDFIARFAPLFPTHLKMDVDGLELQILQGAERTLSDRRLRSAMVELSLTDAGERKQAMTLLERAGLKFVSQGDIQGTGTENAANHLFVRAE